MKKIILIIATITLTSSVLAQIPTQTQVLKEGVFRYFKRLPRSTPSYLLHAMDLGNYHLFTKLHEDYISEQRQSTPFDVFYTHSDKRFPKKENFFSFVNDSYDFKDIVKVEFGLCAGVSILLRRFNMLAYFDQYEQVESAPREGSSKWFSFYKKKIDEIVTEKKPVIIPGFANLLEFSSVPEIKKYIQENVVKEWADSASALWRGVSQQLYSVRGTFTKKEANQLYDELSYKTQALGYSPIVWLAKPNSNPFSKDQWIHVMQVIEVSEPNRAGAYTIKVWDINNHIGEGAIRDVLVNAKGEAYFDGFKLAEIEVLHYDDLEISQMIENKLYWCADHRGLCTNQLSL